MNKPREIKNLLVALDIGTSKIIAIVAEVTPDGALEILGLGQHPSKGLKKGLSLTSKRRSRVYSVRWKKPS